MPFFNRTSPSPPRESVDSRSSSGSSGFLGLGRNKGLDSDPGIIAARQQIAEAERKEREADAALQQARRSAAAARETIRVLEREAQLDAQRAKAKQAEVKVINKSAKHLGRH